MAKHHFIWQPGHRVHMGIFVFPEYIHAGDLKTTFCHLISGDVTFYGDRYFGKYKKRGREFSRLNCFTARFIL